MKTKLLLSFVIGLSFIACDTKEVNYDLIIVSASNLAETADDKISPFIRLILQPNECDESKVIAIPTVKIFRTDLSKDNEFVIEIPSTPDNALRKKLNSYTYVDLKNDYAEFLPSMKSGDFLARKGNPSIKNGLSYNKTNTLVYSISETNSLKETKSKIDSIICVNGENFSKKVVIILNNNQEKGTSGEDEGEGEDEKEEEEKIENPCNTNTVADGLDLKDDLLKIVDTNRSYEDRDKLARATWEKYFDKQASVQMFTKAGQKHPKLFQSGDGSIYLINRLAVKTSITDLNIIRIERNNNNGKIATLFVVECHNASDIL